MLSNKIIWIIRVLGFGALIVPISIGFQKNYKIYTEGKLVPIVVTYVPDIGIIKRQGKLCFDYNGKNRYIWVKGTAINRNFHTGDTTLLRYSKDYDEFKLPNDNPIIDGLVLLGILISGLLASIYYLFYPPTDKKK